MEAKLWAPWILDILMLHTLISLAVSTGEGLGQQALLLEKGGGRPGVLQPASVGMNDQACVGRTQK